MHFAYASAFRFPQSWSLNDCAVPPSSCLKSARLAILPPSTEDYCFVRAVPLADEAFFIALIFRLCVATSRRALLLTNPGCNLFTSGTADQEHSAVNTDPPRSLLRSRRHDAARVQSNKNKTGGIEHIRTSRFACQPPCRDLPAQDNGPDMRSRQLTDHCADQGRLFQHRQSL